MRVQHARRAAGVVVLAVSLSLAGCGGPVTLTGTVTVNGTPLTWGAIIIQPEGAAVITGVIQDGKYEVHGVRGRLKIAVTPGGEGAGAPLNARNADGRTPPGAKIGLGGKETPPGAGGGEKGEKSGGGGRQRIPPEYTNIDTTPVTHDTRDGAVKDIVIP